jgi:hypothetical protein
MSATDEDPALISVRVVTIDHYIAAPIEDLVTNFFCRDLCRLYSHLFLNKISLVTPHSRRVGFAMNYVDKTTHFWLLDSNYRFPRLLVYMGQCYLNDL